MSDLYSTATKALNSTLEELAKVRAERDSLKAQLEEMSRMDVYAENETLRSARKHWVAALGQDSDMIKKLTEQNERFKEVIQILQSKLHCANETARAALKEL